MAPEINWRTINIDLLDPESSANFDISTLAPPVAPVSAADVQSLAGQIRQLLRGGDAEGALRGALENAPYGGDERTKVRGLIFSGLAKGGRRIRKSIRLIRWEMGTWVVGGLWGLMFVRRRKYTWQRSWKSYSRSSSPRCRRCWAGSINRRGGWRIWMC